MSFHLDDHLYRRSGHGWGSGASDSRDHRLKTERMTPTTGEIPRYPNPSAAYNNSHYYHEPEARQEAQSPELEKPAERGSENDECIDVEADDYIKKKHMGFQLCKWQTFKEG
ncbi:hypothetical protein Nepgr_025274 [Nepenthes gracilis]|uniref:Uncharacterized protein n=1 Tax=Nepenthes gracilis TaxID=150966 RepID=A0AAD3Y1B2_NEPGR|nr:hypothetical protein Nepgr_025274 [Nepenthes gracilis]